MAVLVQTTYSITPDPKTIAGYITALEALKAAGAPATTAVSIATDGAMSVTVADRQVIAAIANWSATQGPTPVPVFGG
jgi:hypothetical protein